MDSLALESDIIAYLRQDLPFHEGSRLVSLSLLNREWLRK